MKIVYGIVITLFLLILLVWIGLKVQPKPLPALAAPTANLALIPLPENLPAPVERFYHTLYGDEIPVITSAVISGRAAMRVGPLTFPARFRFSHVAGVDYRHYIEATLFGLPIMKVNETYLEGNSRLELPFGVVENEPKVNQAANLGLWAESIWLAPVFLTDPRVRWEPVDAETAILRVPSEDGEEIFIVRFDPATDLVTQIEAMRYKGAADNAKTLWLNTAVEWGELHGQTTLTSGAVTWLDEGTPWAVFTVDPELLGHVELTGYAGRAFCHCRRGDCDDLGDQDRHAVVIAVDRTTNAFGCRPDGRPARRSLRPASIYRGLGVRAAGDARDLADLGRN